jgi:translation initiation factor 4G
MTSSSQSSSTSQLEPSEPQSIAPYFAAGSNLAHQSRTAFPPSQFASIPHASEFTNMSAAVGGAPSSHGHSDSVNGRNPTIPAIPSVNGSVSLPDHTRKPSMTVTPAGAAGTNGGAPGGGPQNKPTIQFGAMGMQNPQGSPAMGTPPSLAHHNSANLSVSQLNPRATSPSNSPSPIPQPVSVSGGRPPQGFNGQGNAYTFGQLSGDPNDPNVRSTPTVLSHTDTS